MARPLLGDIDLQQVQKIETEEDQVFTQHSIPALEGDFFQQGLGRRATWVKLTGVLTGAEVQDGLKTLRDKFRAAEPVDFVADITTATKVNQVIIEEMGVRELAGKPSRFEYALTLREYVPAPTPQQERPQPIPPRPRPVETGALIVEVVVEGEPNFDYSTVTVTVEGTLEDGTSVSRTLTNRSENIWTEDPFPVGQYTVRAVVTDPPPMNGSVNAVVRGGQTTQVTISLRRDRLTNIAKEFVVHFRFDNAFVEPCMRHVLRQVADYARNHPDEKLLIVGNTDKSGSDDYNLSLGDRRARSVYAYLTFGRNATTRSDALAEWNLLRQPADGQQRTVRDKWGVPQYQYMLQSLGFYPGNIDGQHGPLTNTGVRDFQTSKNLPATGVVNDATWSVLIEAYLSQDPQSVPDTQFLRNCGDEPLKWVSCGEQRPRQSTPTDNCAPELAWRPNRRTELVFVRVDRLPRPEPKPVTFNLPGTPPVGSGWCVGPDDPNASRCSFLKEGGTAPAPDEWSVEPAEPGTITVTGSILDENSNPLGNTKYVLIAPDGEFMDGERKCGPERGRPIIGRTAPDGTFSYTKQTPVGVYTMEVDLPPGPHVAHAATKPPATGRGSVVCKRLDSNDSQFDVIVRSGAASQFAVNPVITLASSVVVVKKSYTNPARKLVTLSTDSTFIGSGTFTRSSDAIRFFTAAVGGTEITFNETDNVFDGTLLTTGVQLFAEGASPSVAMDDVQLTLSLSSADLLVGSPVTATMTSVELTLDICDRRSVPGVDPVPLSTANKINPGRFLQIRNPNNTHERALLIVRSANPVVFTGELVLTPIDGRVQVFAESDEIPAAGQTSLSTPQVISNSTIPADGMKFWAEGVSVSGVLRDTGFQLGIKDVENDGDRVAITVSAFTLNVEGATQIPGTNTFVTTRDPAAVVTVVANHTPLPSPVPANFITWSPNTTPTTDPLRRTVPRAAIGETNITATLTTTGETKSVNIFVIRVTLDVDADRDGIVEEDASGKNTWEFGVGKKGAIILCNNDNDDRPTGNSEIDNQNAVVDGANDVSDLAPLLVRQSGTLPAGVSLVLLVADRDKIRIFDQRSASATAIIGPGSALPAEFAIANSQTADVELGMEATQYPNASFDGLIRLALILRLGTTELARDDVIVRVAPWIMPSHMNVTEELYVVEINGFNTSPPSAFMSSIEATATVAGVPLKKANGNTYGGDPWMQDTMEIGYSRMPIKEIPVVLDAIRTRGLDPYSRNELLGPDYGFTQVSTAVVANTFDSHGNLEVSPPVTVRDPVTGQVKDYKFGRIYFGGRSRTIRMRTTSVIQVFNQDVKRFLEAQRVQSPFEIDTSWLAVGHVDEIISFVPATTDKGFKMLISSSDEAMRILQDIRDNGFGNQLLFAGKLNPPFQQRSVDAVLNDGNLMNDNTFCQTKLDEIQTQMQTELGLDPTTDVVKIPSIFIEYERSPRRVNPSADPLFVALMPGMVNMLVITRPTFAQHQLAIPKPFGPVITPGSVDVFEQDILDRLIPLGYAGSQIHFVDDFDNYHVNDGEVHCGTNSKRTPHTTPWWEQTDF